MSRAAPRIRTGVFASMLLFASFASSPSMAEGPGSSPTSIPLPTSKSLLLPIPGDPHVAGGFPTTIALHPGGRYVALLDGGYGMQDSGLRQGIVVLDLQTNRISHYADPRLGFRAQQTYFLGLGFDKSGDHLFASVASISDPLGKVRRNTGNGIAVYAFARGKVTPERFIPIPPGMVPSGKRAASVSEFVPLGYAVPYPAGLVLFDTPAGERLLVADDLSDDAVLLDPKGGTVLKRFDLSSSDTIPSSFPYGAIVSRDGRRAWISLWNSSEVAELDLESGAVVGRIALSKPAAPAAAGSHPTGMALRPDEAFLFVALANADQVAVIDIKAHRVEGYLSTLLPNQRYGGSFPTALSVNADGTRLVVADSSANAVAVFDLSTSARAPAASRLMGFVPTEWYPTAVAVHGNDLLVVAGKGHGTSPNAYESGQPRPYVAALLAGSIARVTLGDAEKRLPELTSLVVQSNHLDVADAPLFPDRSNPIRHVIYVIKENRTFDQVLGDLGYGDGDPTLTMYGRDVTPNAHELALRFGVLDNFYASGEVSGNGHVWSTAAITSDYTEKTWQINYRGKEHTFDFEGEVAGELPMLENVPDVNEPATGYLWVGAARKGLSYRDYGEFISTVWCDSRKLPPYLARHAERLAARCVHPTIHQGEPLPPRLGQPPGSKSPWPWQVPVPILNVPGKPELRDHFDPYFPSFQIDYPDQLRVDEFLAEFAEFVRGRERGIDKMPAFIVMRLPNDHTGGTRPGMPRPRASVADNDLAFGRLVEAVSRSPYWNDTALLVLEDDAQNGADHVDAHRTIGFVISKYAPRHGKPVVVHDFYTTVSMVHTVEALLGLPPMNANDAFAPVMAPLFSGAGDQPPFQADYRNRDNGLIYQTNPSTAVGAAASGTMDFSRPDAVDSRKLNRILWEDAMGRAPPPRRGRDAEKPPLR